MEGCAMVSTYLRLFAVVLSKHSLTWWVSLCLSYIFGVGWVNDYGKVRATLMPWPPFSFLPEELPWWMIFVPLLVWLTVSFAHRETMRRLIAGRVTFEAPEIHYD